MKLVQVKKLFPDANIPTRATDGSVGYDLYAYHLLARTREREHAAELPFEVPPQKAALFGVGIAMKLPFPWEGQVRPRSGLANLYDVELSNSPGTVDPDYRGEVSVLLRNRGEVAFAVDKGARIAQILFNEVKIPHLEIVEELPNTSRGVGGFGSTGLYDIALGDAGYQTQQARLDAYFMKIAVAASELSNCLRGCTRGDDGEYPRNAAGFYVGATRRFGCVIVKGTTIVGQGFNRRNMDCTEREGCIRERENISTGESNDRGCDHAEQVAFQHYMQEGGTALRDTTIYVNAEPCVMCAKWIAGSGATAVVVPEGVFPKNGLLYLRDAGIEIRRAKTN